MNALTITLSGLAGLSLLAGATSAGEDMFGPSILLSDSIDGAISIHAADLDADGDLDILTASWHDDLIRWFENTDGKGAFGPEQIISNLTDRAYSVDTADFDGDGDLDVLSASFADNKIAWYENTDGLATFGPQQIINGTAIGAWSAQAGDLDGDGDPDVASVSDTIDTVFWYENTDGLGSFGPPTILSTTSDGAVNISIADLDGDLDNDLLVASSLDDTVAWFENTDGLGTFSASQPIITTADGVRSAHAADLDGDGDLDVLSASGTDDTVSWHENTDGLATFGPRQIITSLADGARTVWTGDLDNDGDLDVLAASIEDDTVAWFENLDGLGSFGPEQVMTSTADGAFSVRTYDFDGDGDLEVIAGAVLGDEVFWFENSTANWTVLGGGTPGQAGLPSLTGCGPLSPNSAASIDLVNAPPSAAVLLWISLTSSPIMALGGTLHAFPFASQLFFAADADGNFSAPTTWPPGLPSGTQAWFQFLLADPSTPQGIGLSNGLLATTP